MQPRPEVRAQSLATGVGERRAHGLPAPLAARSSRLSRVATTAVTLTALAALGWVVPASAQVGLGAERYEVTITPPKRPGTETPAAAAPPAAPSANETLGALDAPGADAAAAPQQESGAVGATPGMVPGVTREAKSGTTANGAGAPTGPAAAGAASAAVQPAPARDDAKLPKRTLQVGAFRQHKSALAMRDKLAASFPDVVIVELQSGGEALYRVNVGRMPRGAALDDLRRRVIAAGHPAFEVPAPAAD